MLSANSKAGNHQGTRGCGKSSYLPSSATELTCSDWRAIWLDKWRMISEPISNGSRSLITIRSIHTSIWLYAAWGAMARPIRLKRDYVKHGIRGIAEDICTRQIGYRTSRDAADAERREIGEPRFTSLDRAILREAQKSPPGPESSYFIVVKNPALAGLNDAARLHLNHVVARLAVLQRMGLAELAAPHTWHVRYDVEESFEPCRRARDRQKTLAAHGVPVSDERLQTEMLDMRQLTAVEGRILVHGQDEESGQNYLILEGTDAEVHFIYYTPEMDEVRGRGGLRTNYYVRLRKLFVAGRPTLDIRDLGDAEKLLNNRRLLEENVRELLKCGAVPTEDGWGGWLGKYQAALASAANEIGRNRELQPALPPERRRDRSRGR